MSESSWPPIDDARPEAVIAGTLCLMSCYVQHPVAIYAERVSINLSRMAGFQALSPELRTICRRLAERWDGIQNDARCRAANGETIVDGRAIH